MLRIITPLAVAPVAPPVPLVPLAPVAPPAGDRRTPKINFLCAAVALWSAMAITENKQATAITEVPASDDYH